MAYSAIGLDLGSSACKAVYFENGQLQAYDVVATGWSPKATAREMVDRLLAQGSTPKEEIKLAATGYGRVSIDFADKLITEITCHARGADYLLPGVRTVLDIGGQDAKVISVKDGKVLDFLMNDKCAAGTGRFVEMSANRVGFDLSELPDLLATNQSCELSSTCAVFADSEIVSQMAAGRTKEEIAGGVIRVVTNRAVALAGRMDVQAPVLLTGGLAGLDKLRENLENDLGYEVYTNPMSRYAGAIGAALIIGKI